MTDEVNKYVNLDNLGQGAARELFQKCLMEVIENMLDPNTSETAKRKVVLEVSITPDKNTEGLGFVQISCHSSLARPKGYDTQFFFGKKDGQAMASEYHPDQMELFKSDNVKELQKKTENK